MAFFVSDEVLAKPMRSTCRLSVARALKKEAGQPRRAARGRDPDAAGLGHFALILALLLAALQAFFGIAGAHLRRDPLARCGRARSGWTVSSWWQRRSPAS